jgi:hypothetical protein
MLSSLCCSVQVSGESQYCTLVDGFVSQMLWILLVDTSENGNVRVGTMLLRVGAAVVGDAYAAVCADAGNNVSVKI